MIATHLKLPYFSLPESKSRHGPRGFLKYGTAIMVQPAMCIMVRSDQTSPKFDEWWF